MIDICYIWPWVHGNPRMHLPIHPGGSQDHKLVPQIHWVPLSAAQWTSGHLTQLGPYQSLSLRVITYRFCLISWCHRFIIFKKNTYIYIYYWSIVDLQCCRFTAWWFRYTNTHTLFLKLFSIVGYYKILTIVHYAIQ